MEFVINDKGGQRDVVLSGRLTFVDHARMRDIIDGFKGGAVKTCKLDLAGVEFIDSAAMGMLLLARDTAVASHVHLTLKGARQEIKRLMAVARFDTLFEMQD